MTFVERAGIMFDSAGDDDELTGGETDVSLAELHYEFAGDDEKQLVFAFV
jgi:hypothetical protein